MYPLSNQRWMLPTVLALFLIGQGLAFAHASEDEADHYEHCGTLCAAMLSDEPEALLPVMQASRILRPELLSQTVALPADPPLVVSVLDRPPATGPPAN